MSVQSDNFFKPGPSEQHAEQPVDTGQPESMDDLDTLRAELAELEQKADDYLRLAQRTQADFINYRRRTEEERTQQAREANVAYLQRLLPVLDDFERALSNAAPDDLESSWGKGILLVDRNLRGLLTADDVQRIAAEGAEFDPREHEALGSQASAEVPEGHVLHVVRQGYRKGERILRPAQVIVASRPDA
ncbi:MAG: nucleotide exchange factor GrpE [Chloroflexota bacterium]|nr:nucleotide exchange factor GrpE [Chloroflexota bacterium]